MIISINAGHGGRDPGAVSGGYREADVARQIVAEFMKQGKACGVSMHDGTDPNGSTNSQADKANAAKADIAVSIHLNAGGGTGVEVYYAANTNAANIELCKRVSAAIAFACGFLNRGAKKDVTQRLLKGMNFLRRTNMPAMLIEWCFIDSRADMQKVIAGIPAGVKAVLDTIAGSQPERSVVAEAVLPQSNLPKAGMTDHEVRFLQAAVKTPVDGEWGPDSEKKYQAWRKGDFKRGTATEAETRWAQYVTGAGLDGIWGPETDLKVAEAQNRAGTTPDKWIGPQTLAAWGYR